MKYIDVERLTSKGGVLVLGAGASREFGFPLWADLEGHLRERWSDSDFRVRWDRHITKEGDLSLDELLNAFLAELDDPRDRTIDQIVEFLAETSGAERLFRFSIAEVMSDMERNDHATLTEHRKTGWVENLANSIASLPSMGELNVITLNYERSFQYRLETQLAKFPGIKPKRERKSTKIFNLNMIHVHGSIGFLPEAPPGMSTNPIVDTWQVQTHILRSYGQREDLVFATAITTADGARKYPDEALDTDTAYFKANSLLSSAQYAAIVGVSPLGLRESLLASGDPIPDAATVVFTNSDDEGGTIPDCLKGGDPQFLGLHTNLLAFR